jgi:signal transduction histidine kinase
MKSDSAGGTPRFSFGIRTQVLLLSVIPLAFLVTLLAIASVLETISEQDARWSSRSTEELALSEKIDRTIALANRSVLAYAATRSSASLGAYRSAAGTVPGELDRLRDESADQPGVASQAVRVRAASAGAMDLLAKFLADVKAGHLAQARALGTSPKTQRIAREWLAAKDGFNQAIRTTALARIETLQRQAAPFRSLQLGCTLVGILTTLLIAAQFGLRITRRLRLLIDRAHLIEIGQTTTGTIGGSDEIANLDRVYQQITRRMQEANAGLRTEVTERARIEEALRQANAAADAAIRELEAFSYSVAHDLRAPLRSIDGFTMAVIEDSAEKLDADGKTHLGYVRESAQHMATLIDDLLTLSRVTRRTELHRSQTNLAEIAQGVFAHLKRDEPDRDVELVVTAEIPAVADPALLKVVFENLLGNAWKFTGKRPRARIEVGQTSEAGLAVYFVRDDGAGFDMEYSGKLFEAFQRLHHVSEFPGNGIGLATVQRIIQRHGGRIWAESAVGRGATFFFTLEAAKVPAGVAVP